MATLDDVAVGRKARRKLTGYWLILPGAIWLALFFVVPLFSLLSSSLYDPEGSVLTGYSMTWHVQNFADAFSEHWRTLVRSPRSSAC
jgi:spermidine/putrescine transport system permease protein